MNLSPEVIINNFSKSSSTYDEYADIQRRAAFELFSCLGRSNLVKILEIGCGTGNYTVLLREKFPRAELKAIDISVQMLEAAARKLKDKTVELLACDAQLIRLEGDFDLVTSNACFNWFSDLSKAVVKYKDALKKDGMILFSIFGPQTFHELNTCLKYVYPDFTPFAESFLRADKVRRLLEENFRAVEVKEAVYEEVFSSLFSLLNKIKHSGIRGKGLGGKIFFTPAALRKIEAVYLEKFGCIRVTYQVFFCRGIK